MFCVNIRILYNFAKVCFILFLGQFLHVALVLTPDNGIYIPETILPIDGAYQNARLIAMPDEAWLRPDTIFSVKAV